MSHMVIIDGVQHPVKKVPMSTGKSKFKAPAASRANSSNSVFDQFYSSNGGRHKSL